MGSALIRALAALDHAEQLNIGTTYLDIPLVITSFLYWSSDLADYGIEGDATAWRPHAAAYFKKSRFDESKGITETAKLLTRLRLATKASLLRRMLRIHGVGRSVSSNTGAIMGRRLAGRDMILRK
jgi:hypothetical protein